MIGFIRLLLLLGVVWTIITLAVVRFTSFQGAGLGLIGFGYAASVLGRWYQSKRNAEREIFRSKRTNLLLDLLNLSRPVIWFCIGCALMASDLEIAISLILTRVPGALLISSAILQRKGTLPLRTLLSKLCLPVLLVVLAGVLAYKDSANTELLNVLYYLSYTAFFLTVLLTAAQVVVEWRSWKKGSYTAGLGLDRFFQWGLFINYGVQCAVGLIVSNQSLGQALLLAYGSVLIVQTILIIQIEIGVFSHRKRKVNGGA